MDIHYGVPLSPLVDVRDGDYDDLAGASLVILTTGVNEKGGSATDRKDPAGRLRLLDAKCSRISCHGWSRSRRRRRSLS